MGRGKWDERGIKKREGLRERDEGEKRRKTVEHDQ